MLDNNISNFDNCIFMQAGNPWWLSNDLQITGPRTDGKAQRGVKNDVQLVVRRKPQGCNLPDNTDAVKVDLYICSPTASPITSNTSQVKKILDSTGTPSEILVDINSLPSGGLVSPLVKWDLPATSSHPAETPGHKCMVARAYPSQLNVSTSTNIGDFVGWAAPPNDQHYAQRNICIETCDSPCGVDVWTENATRETKKDVTFRVVADQNPPANVVDVVVPVLRNVPEFKRLVPGAPRKGFTLEFPDFPKAKVTDNTRSGCLSAITRLFSKSKGGISPDQPNFAAQIQLAPGQVSTYRFMTDLDGASSGDAHIFHLTHEEGGRMLNGLTIIMVKR